MCSFTPMHHASSATRMAVTARAFCPHVNQPWSCQKIKTFVLVKVSDVYMKISLKLMIGKRYWYSQTRTFLKPKGVGHPINIHPPEAWKALLSNGIMFEVSC